MIKMLDKKGTGRVYENEFLRMAKGLPLTPIGLALPPTT